MQPIASPLPITHRSVLTVAIPIMLSNVTVPLIGVVNTAVVGQLPEAYYIGAVAIGSLIFSFLFWGFGFLRLSTGGLSAQAIGAGDQRELEAVFWRALVIAVTVGICLIAASPLIEKISFDLMGGSTEIRRHGEIYFRYRILSAPFALINLCVMGWFVGQGRTGVAFLVQIFLNLTNMCLGALLVFSFGMTTDGVGLSALIAETLAALLGVALAWRFIRRLGTRAAWSDIWHSEKIRRTLLVNGDIMVRTLCLVFAFGWFAARGARSGDITIAANAVLLHFFEVAAYLIDGFAYASEALVGQAVGARNRQRFHRAIRITSIWAIIVGASCSAIIWFAGHHFLDLMSVNPGVREMARLYLPLASLTPLLGCICFQFDGIYTGALATRDMRNMMIVSLAIYLAATAVLEPRYGNLGLWLGLCLFFIARSVTFALRMPALTRQAFA